MQINLDSSGTFQGCDPCHTAGGRGHVVKAVRELQHLPYWGDG